MTDQTDHPLPEWAMKRANGYTLAYTALPTRDGRRCGNAVNVGPCISLNPETTYKVVTDAGNILKCTERELRELFHEPEYIMVDLLPAHKEALCRDEAEQV